MKTMLIAFCLVLALLMLVPFFARGVSVLSLFLRFNETRDPFHKQRHQHYRLRRGLRIHTVVFNDKGRIASLQGFVLSAGGVGA